MTAGPRSAVIDVPAPGIGRPRAIAPALLMAMLVAVYVLHMLDRQIIAILLEPLRRELVLNDAQLGLLSGLAYSGAAIVTGIPLGMLADRVSRKKLLLSALTLWSLLTAACGMAASYPMLLLARMGVGAAESGAPPACLSMIGDAFPAEKRGRATSVFYASGGIGTILSFTLGAWIATTWGWRWAFLAAAVPGLILAVLLAIFLVEPAREQRAHTDLSGDDAGVLATLRQQPLLILLIAAMALGTVGPTAMGTWASSLLIRDHGLSLQTAGLVVAMSSGIIGPLGQLTGGLFGDRLAARAPGRQMLFAAVGSLIGAAVASAGILSGITAFTIAGLWCGAFGMMFCIGPSYSSLITLAPVGRRATILAVTTVVANLAAYGGGPVLVGIVSDAIGGARSLTHAIPVALIAPVISAGLFVLIARHMARTERQRLEPQF
ncbi:MFS transporter (plasmid) [Sphingomonas paeninsulae]|uniref:MFS transporter n=1 Tax=Sphingomonas paeninsulae TaxID=2319844 RepID=A0A494TIN1_SPHPE|nr:MFS transporter [Sphingomonas paeninsulae]AYJ85005.1 MFS transporter [Sphingomonas paeninsulae]